MIADNRAGLRMLKAVCRLSLEVMRRSKDRAVLVVTGDLLILVVVTGRGMQAGFSDIEARHTAIVIFQIHIER